MIQKCAQAGVDPIAVELSYNKNFLVTGNDHLTASIPIAVAVNSYARIHMFKLMK